MDPARTVYLTKVAKLLIESPFYFFIYIVKKQIFSCRSTTTMWQKSILKKRIRQLGTKDSLFIRATIIFTSLHMPLENPAVLLWQVDAMIIIALKGD